MTDEITELRGSYVKNCRLQARENDTLFYGRNGQVFATLDGYTILPNEEYDKLIQVTHQSNELDPHTAASRLSDEIEARQPERA